LRQFCLTLVGDEGGVASRERRRRRSHLPYRYHVSRLQPFLSKFNMGLDWLVGETLSMTESRLPIKGADSVTASPNPEARQIQISLGLLFSKHDWKKWD